MSIRRKKKQKKNCVDYVAHTCAVPEGRAATENVGDRQEWFKTDFLGFFFFYSSSSPFWVVGASISSLLLPFGLVFLLLPPPPTHLLPRIRWKTKVRTREGKPLGKDVPEGGNTRPRRRRTEGGGPRGIDHTQLLLLFPTNFFSSSSTGKTKIKKMK